MGIGIGEPLLFLFVLAIYFAVVKRGTKKAN